MINPYHVQVRRRKPSLDQSSKSETEEDSSKSSDDDSNTPNNSSTANPYYVKMSLQLYQVDYKSFLLDFKSVPNVNNPQIPKPWPEKRHSLTNGNSGSRRESNHDVLAESSDKENLLQAVNGCSSNGNYKIYLQ